MIQDLASIWQNQFLETLISLHSLERDFMKKFSHNLQFANSI